MKTTPAISLPQGVRDILPDEAQKITSLENSILSVFASFGFKKVETPLLEFLDVLDIGLDSYLKDKVLKFIDPNTGRVVAIRPDITPQIARMAATRLKDAPKPLKLCYNQSVIRYHESNGGNAAEFLQAGAEYISKEASPEIDAEMIVMAIESIKGLGIKDFKIDIGDVGFVKSIFDRLILSDKELKALKNAIAKKDAEGVSRAIDTTTERINDSDRKLLSALTTFYGEDEILDIAGSFKGADAGVLAYLTKIIEIISKKGYHEYVTIDLGEVRGFDYYTGVIIEGFASGIGKPILYGGRYDSLAGRYGMEAASTGFAFDINRLQSAIDNI